MFKNKGSIKDVSSYRPISVISHISKILESGVKEQIFSHLINHKLLSSAQFAYVKGKSTQLALHTIIERYLKNIDNGEITASCFLDLSKCFDTVPHSLLLNKLSSFGISGTEHDWFKSYLTNRTQIVKYNGTLSTPKALTIGVPQGTILGPVLYILYANDLTRQLPKGCVTIYADDITLYCSGKNIHVAESKLQNCVDLTVKWLKHNRLVVNPSKSTTMLIGTRPKTKNINLAIYIDNIRITQETSIKLLGVEVDANLTWNTHISTLAKKISSKIGLVKRLQQFLPSNTVLSLYPPIIQSHIGLWSNTLG